MNHFIVHHVRPHDMGYCAVIENQFNLIVAYFLSEEDAMEYCKYLNEKEGK